MILFLENFQHFYKFILRYIVGPKNIWSLYLYLKCVTTLICFYLPFLTYLSCLSVYLSILPTCIPTNLPVYLFTSLHTCLPTYLSAYLQYVYLSTYLPYPPIQCTSPAYLPILPTNPPTCLPTY